MGFELLPIEEGDEDKYDIITIISPGKWNPQKFLGEIPQEPAPYEPTDEEIRLSEVLANHTSSEDSECIDDSMIKLVDPYTPMMETQVLAASAYRRSVHDQLDPEKLRPYLGRRPVKVVKETLKKTTQLARMVIRYPLRRHIKSRFPFLNVTRIDEAVSTDCMFANCRSIFHGYIAAQVFYGVKLHTIYVYGIRSKGSFPRSIGISSGIMGHHLL